MTAAQIVELFQNWGGLIPHFGMTIDAEQPDLPCTMEIDLKKCSAPHVAHGGAVMALMDTALGMLSLKTSFEQGLAASTVEMKVNFLSPAKHGDVLVARSQIVSKGKTLLVISGRAIEKSSGRDVAFALGTFNMYALSADSEVSQYINPS